MDDPSHDLSYASWGAIFIVISIGHLSTKGHHREIYLIWYINSLFFTLFYGLGIIAEQKNVRLTEVCGTYQENCKAVYEYLTNVQGELSLIAVVSALAIGPQLLTYILSGLSGSASTPRFVSQIAKIAAWSFVKFAAGLGGILIAEPMAKLTVGKPVAFHDFIAGWRYTCLSFLYAWLYITTVERLPVYLLDELRGWPLRILLIFHRFFTRYIREQTSR